MKFFHAADIHFGCQPDHDMPWSKERSFDILAAFRSLVMDAKREQIDLLLISGDVFHHQPSNTELKEVNALFQTIPKIPVCFIAGNHDCVRLGSSYAEFKWNPNVHFLSGKELSSVSFPNLKTTVWGFSYPTREIKEPVFDTLMAPDQNQFHILLAHGGDANHIPLDRKHFAESGFAYTALGHIHKMEMNQEGRYAYPGSLSPIDLTESGAHGYISGEITPSETDPRGNLRIAFVPVESRIYITCRVRVTPKTTNQSLFGTISRFIEQYGPSNIFKVILTGLRDPDVNFDEKFLRTCGRIITFSDETLPDYNITQLYHEHNRDMIGTYMDAFRDQDLDADPIRKKAFNYGLHALLANCDAGKGGNS